jgi:integrase
MTNKREDHMAAFKQLASGNWQAQVRKAGKRLSNTFPTKKAAKDWAAREEYLAVNAKPVGSTMLVRDVFDRYANEVSVLRKGVKFETLRLASFGRDKLGSIKIADLKPADIADWRDRRLLDVMPASVAREMNIISGVMTVARKEWGLLSSNPVSDVRKPKKPPPRDRVATDSEVMALALSAGSDLKFTTARVFHAFLFACETAMRAGEIVALTWEHVDLDRRVAHLITTKNGHPRDVPLSTEAVRLLKALPEADPVFEITSAQADALFRKIRIRAAIEGLTFHDSRRTATTKLAKKLDVLELAKMTGHRDLKILLNTYYKADAADVARKLD